MKYFYVSTQVLENYGAHADDGRFTSGNAYWKFKGGDDYIVSGVDREQDAVAFVAAITMANEISYKEFPCRWQEVASDFMTEYERSQLEYEGKVVYPAKRYNVQEYFKMREAA